MEYILNNTLLALLDYPGSTMLGVNRMLADKPYRLKVIEKIKDPIVKAFWVSEFAKYNEKFATEAIAPIQNKVGQFLSASIIRNIVGQVKSTINIREIMDSGKILILNLSKGRIGEDNSRLLGGMLITKIQLSAMERVDVPEEERRDFFLYVDEFQNYATESFANILSEARKYHLSLIMAHQYIEQLDETVRAAVFGNVGTIITFRVGAGDAEFLVKEFTPRFVEEDLVNLPKHAFYIKLMIDGLVSDPFSSNGLPPFPKEDITGNEEKVIRITRERYAKKREIVEEKISRWTESMQEEDRKREEQQGARMASRERFDRGGQDRGFDRGSDRRNDMPQRPRPSRPRDQFDERNRGPQRAPSTPPIKKAPPLPLAPAISLTQLAAKKPTSFTPQKRTGDKNDAA